MKKKIETKEVKKTRFGSRKVDTKEKVEVDPNILLEELKEKYGDNSVVADLEDVASWM